MIIGKENVEKFIRYNKTPYWRIKRSESEQHSVAVSGNDENIPMEESVNRLREVFGILSPGNYFIEAWATSGQTKNWNRDHFQILPQDKDYVGSANIQQIAPQPAVNIQDEVDKALAKYKTEVELQDLRRRCSELEKENKELQSGIESSLSRIYNKVEPYLGMILNVKEPAGAAVGSVEAGDAQRRLEKAFEVWQESEGDVVTMIEKIAALSKEDPGTYSMARKILTGK